MLSHALRLAVVSAVLVYAASAIPSAGGETPVELLDQARLCKSALTASLSDWSTFGTDRLAVEEARRRGLTTDACRKTVQVNVKEAPVELLDQTKCDQCEDTSTNKTVFKKVWNQSSGDFSESEANRTQPTPNFTVGDQIKSTTLENQVIDSMSDDTPGNDMPLANNDSADQSNGTSGATVAAPIKKEASSSGDPNAADKSPSSTSIQNNGDNYIPLLKKNLETSDGLEIISRSGQSGTAIVHNCNNISGWSEQTVRAFFSIGKKVFPTVLEYADAIYCDVFTDTFLGVPVLLIEFYPNEIEMMRPKDTAVIDYYGGYVSASVTTDDSGNKVMEYNGWKAGRELGSYCHRRAGDLTSGACRVKQQTMDEAPKAKSTDPVTFEAILTCGINRQVVHTAVCFQNSDLTIRANGNTTVYNRNNFHSLGGQNYDGSHIILPESFELRAQNSHNIELLQLVVKNQRGEITYQDMVGQYGVIAVRN